MEDAVIPPEQKEEHCMICHSVLTDKPRPVYNFVDIGGVLWHLHVCCPFKWHLIGSASDLCLRWVPLEWGGGGVCLVLGNLAQVPTAPLGGWVGFRPVHA